MATSHGLRPSHGHNASVTRNKRGQLVCQEYLNVTRTRPLRVRLQEPIGNFKRPPILTHDFEDLRRVMGWVVASGLHGEHRDSDEPTKLPMSLYMLAAASLSAHWQVA